MEKGYDFDHEIERRGTGALKHDCLTQFFGRDGLQPLWVADMDFEVCPLIIDALRRRLDHPILGYSATPDSYWTSIRSWLSRRHGLRVAPEEITFAPGVVKGLGFAVNYFTREGDGIVIQPPVYHPFKMVIEGNKRRCIENPLTEDYRMDLDALEKIVEHEKPRMLVLCNPHNPVGIQWDEATLARLAAIARKAGMVVVSDEIHADLMLWGGRHIPFLAAGEDAQAVGVMLGAPSKTFNIPGMVSSWIVVKNPELREGFFNWLASNEFNEAPMTAVIAAEAAYTHGEKWLNQLLQYIEGTVIAVEEYVNKNLPGIKAIRPQASFLVWLDCRGLGLTHARLIDLFIHRAGLALNDGAMFGTQGSGFMRLNVASPRHRILAALESLKNALPR
ncbi:MAG: PatB family C-S lyase [Bacteroidales bacterium]|nr:PatB family C-S lyase [Bacteroidales bacterium]